MKVLVTGAAGFIGFHLCKKLLGKGTFEVTGIDSINNYYDPQLKYDRLKELGIPAENLEKEVKNFAFRKIHLEDKQKIDHLFQERKFDVVINLAAQAGVRYSLKNPYAYLDSNLTGFLNILEASRHTKVDHLIYASSSSVYGLNKSMPFKVQDNVDHPISLYAATKKSNELMAHTYSYLYQIPTTGLRFFTVYGPWGRPDMALFIFTSKILKDEPIEVFNHGNMRRDFTYIDDIVEGIYRLIDKKPAPNDSFDYYNPNPAVSVAPYKVFNIGNNSPVNLMDFIHSIEEEIGKKAKIDFKPIQPGDVPETYADVKSLFGTIDFRPQTSIKEGVKRFVHWYKDYYRVAV